MKKNLKQKMKQDEFRSGLEHAWEFVRTHREEFKIGALIAGVVIVIGGGVAYFQQQRRQGAERAFGEAQAIYDGTVLSELPEGQKPAGQSFATAAEKFQKAQAAFDTVAKKYGSSAVGQRARYYSALSRIELGDSAGGEKDLQDLAARSDGDRLVSALARLALAEAQRRRGDLDKAVTEYRRLVDDPQTAVPRDHALMRLASALEEAGHAPEAETAYRRLVEEFPTSVYASDARRRVQYLEPTRQG